MVTPNLSVQEGALLEASTLGTQSGGDIVLSLGRLTVLEGGQIIASSVGSGTAGTVRIDATEGIQIAGSDLTFADRVAQISETADRANPESTISVQSRADGAAGDIIIGAAGTTPEIVLDDGGQIIAESAAVDGGNITLNLTELLLLRNGSLISASAGTEQAGGNGGNINISVPFIIAIPEENSDIAADAFEGTGGNVTINARGVFGIAPRAERTPLSDITASSELGITGTVNFNVLDTSFIEGSLTDLSGDLVSPEALTAGSCIARSDDTTGSFVVTGAEGLPQRPDGEPVSAYPTGAVRAVADSPAETLREPDGVYRLADGRLVLSVSCR